MILSGLSCSKEDPAEYIQHLDGYWETSLKPWDMAAGSVLIKEAGGWIGDFKGKNDDIFRKSFLATNLKLKNKQYLG